MHKRYIVLRLFCMASLVGLLAVALTACGGTNAPTAQQLITNAQAAIAKVKSYHFTLQVDHPGTGGTIVIKTADGDVLVPDKLKANASVLLLGNAVKVQVISIGAQQYITDPITGKWQSINGLLDPRTLSDPKKGVTAILGHLSNPSSPSDGSVDGTSCWNINGTLDAQYLAGITQAPAPSGSKVAITTCIGKADNLPYLIRVTGIAAAGDTSQTVRTFKLSRFGESLTITAPI